MNGHIKSDVCEIHKPIIKFHISVGRRLFYPNDSDSLF